MRTAGSIALGLALAAITAWLAHLHVVSQTYHPVVQLAAPDGLVYTAVQDAKHARQECGAANDRLLAPVKKDCKDCRVVLARCEREGELQGHELAVYEGRVPEHIVSGPGLRLAITGPEATAKASCQLIASHMVRSGLTSAVCRAPA